jgi:predicted porin
MISALTASTPFFASAHSNLSICGLVDIGIASEDVGTSGTRKTALVGGSQGQTRLGFRGTEDLGGGLTALFNIETGFKLDTGEMGSSTAFFARRSVVGLEGSFGSVMLGREYTPIARVAAATDPLGHGF